MLKSLTQAWPPLLQAIGGSIGLYYFISSL